MPFCLAWVCSPRIKAMSLQQKTMRVGVLWKKIGNAAGKLHQILRILQNGQPFPMFVGAHAGKSLQHLVSFDRHALLGRVPFREHGAPNRMRVQYRACSSSANDGEMKQGFSGRMSFSTKHAAIFVNFQDLVASQEAFVQSRRCDRQPQWLSIQDCAEISAGAQGPATRVKTSADLRKLFSHRIKGVIHPRNDFRLVSHCCSTSRPRRRA